MAARARVRQASLFAEPKRPLPFHHCAHPGCMIEGSWGEGPPLTMVGAERWWCTAHRPLGFMPGERGE